MALTVQTFATGTLSTNCYLIFDPQTKTGFLVDSPEPGNELNKFIQLKGIELAFIVLTHAHFDHIEGLNHYSVPFYVDKRDYSLLTNPALNGSLFFGTPVTIEKEPEFYPQAGPLTIGRYSLEIFRTPGHTPGSVSLKLDKWLFSGDALFFDTIGRTDIPLASSEVLIASIKEKLLTLPDDTIVYPGHGGPTTIGREKKHNPFLK